jgi:hypothetical protein
VVAFEIDHIQPVSKGGADDLENLCLCCITCNRHKNAAQTGRDPETKNVESLFNPRTQKWKDHFVWSEDGIRLIGLTPTGRATIRRLDINHQEVLEARAKWVEAGWHPPK